MQFNTDPNFSKKKEIKKSFYDLFASQPHQPFFANGILFLTLSIILIPLVNLGLFSLEVPITLYHGYYLVYVIFVQFFVGFLYTIFPRFLVQAEIEQTRYMRDFAFYFFGTLLFFISLFISLYLTIIASIAIFIGYILSFNTLYKMQKKSLTNSKYDTKWVLIAFFAGVISNAMFIISMFEIPYFNTIQSFSLYAGFYLFLFTLTFAISQRMIPFFTSAKKEGYVINKSKNIMEKVFILFFLKVLFMTFNYNLATLFIDISLTLFFVNELRKWKLPLFEVAPIMWVLYLSLYWIPIGFLLSSLEAILPLLGFEIFFEKSVIHIFAIGYLMTILIGFGTRVVLGHSGRAPTADKITTLLFILIQFVLIIRLVASFSLNFSSDYLLYINISAFILFALLCVWIAKYLQILIKLK